MCPRRDPHAASPGSLDRLPLSSGTNLPYYHTHPLSGAVEVEQAVIVVHGVQANAADYFNTMVALSSRAGVQATTIIIAPRFQVAADGPEPHDAVWPSHSSWGAGGKSTAPSEGAGGKKKRISSYAAMDEMLQILGDADRFPNLTRVTLVGHSGGGQLVHRYAIGGRAPDAMRAGVRVRFVAANPSSYLYFTADRPVHDDATTTTTSSCQGYNDYKYGLDGRNVYMRELTGQELGERYARRRVTYLLGTDDVYQNHDIDMSCKAKVQGEHRLARGKNYYASIKKLFPSAVHEQIDVPGVGHDQEKMFGSEQGCAAIFGACGRDFA